MARAQDVKDLKTPEQVYHGLRLDYPDTTFTPDQDVIYTIRFKAQPDNVGKMADGFTANTGTTPGVNAGHGFIKNGDTLIPEYHSKTPVTLQDGAEIWALGKDGVERIVAIFKDGRFS